MTFLAYYDDYERSVYEDWGGVVDAARKMGCPVKIEHMGGNLYSFMVVGEDPLDYVHAHCGDEESSDNGDWYINVLPREEITQVEGNRYVEDEQGNFTFSRPEVVPIFGDPMSDDDVAMALVEVWKLTRDAPTDYGSN